jgi:hypothetical protein
VGPDYHLKEAESLVRLLPTKIERSTPRGGSGRVETRHQASSHQFKLKGTGDWEKAIGDSEIALTHGNHPHNALRGRVRICL